MLHNKRILALYFTFFLFLLGIASVKLFADQTLQEKINSGRIIYRNNCASCHQLNGSGIKPYYPPLAKSDFINGNKERAIKVVAFGLNAPIIVNGNQYDGFMPYLGLTNRQIANVLTFVYNSWGNEGGEISEEEVRKITQE